MGEYGTKVCYKIIVLFIAMIAGYIAKKAKLLDKSSTKSLSGILANITNPCLIIASLQIEKEASLLKNAGIVLLMSFIIHIFMSFFSHFIFKGVKERPDRSVYTFGLTYMNCGFMGYPLVYALFGDEGLFYGVIYTVAFNLLSWSHGVYVMNNGQKKMNIKKILNPCIICTSLSMILYITNIRIASISLWGFPLGDALFEGIDMVGDMTFPLSMFIIGSLLGDQKLTKIVKEYKLMAFTFLKLAIVPLMMLGVCIFIKDMIGLKISMLCITMCAAPTAANTAVVSELYDGNSGLAAKLVGITTLFCLISMPLVLILAENIL